jgi:D,D-heptose 1,7-bisphosphate phosphatase
VVLNRDYQGINSRRYDKKMKNKAIFLDRDGTINVDLHYLDDPGKFEMYPYVGEGIKRLKELGFRIIVITNQSGIARGFFTKEELSKIHDRMRVEFQKFDVEIDGIYYCPHHPDDMCNCRKPKTELFKKAIRDHNIDVKLSYMIGDKILDIGAGTNIGVMNILIPEPHMRGKCLSKKDEWEYYPDYIAENFFDVVEWIMKHKKK